jgi:hypothetical protein
MFVNRPVYASQVISAALRPFTKHSQFQIWTPITVPELEKFWGLMFVTRIINKSALKLYWFNDHVFQTMTRNRSESIMSLLHFSDNSRHDINDELIRSDSFKVKSRSEDGISGLDIN